MLGNIAGILQQKAKMNLLKILAKVIESYIKNTLTPTLRNLLNLFPFTIPYNLIPKHFIFFTGRPRPHAITPRISQFDYLMVHSLGIFENRCR